MFRAIKHISFIVFLFMFFLPLGSCTLVEGSDGASFVGKEELKSLNPIKSKLVELKVIDLDKGYNNIGLLVVLILTLALANPPKYFKLMKLAGAFFTFILGVIYVVYCVHIQMCEDQTVYGYIFMVCGFVYIFMTVNSYLPTFLKFA